METVRCPHCGSPVTLYENSWECGWCGDFGNIASLSLSEQVDLPVCSMDHIAFDVLERGVFSILQGIRSRFGNGDTENRVTFELAIYGICQGLLPLHNRTQRNQQLLQAFFQEYPVCTVQEVMDSVRQQKLPFEEQFSLSKQYIGSFWKSLISEIPDDVSCEACPDWIDQIIEGLSQVESVFSGADHSKLYETFWRPFIHIGTHALRHPDPRKQFTVHEKISTLVNRTNLVKMRWPNTRRPLMGERCHIVHEQ